MAKEQEQDEEEEEGKNKHIRPREQACGQKIVNHNKMNYGY
jgi:hypothetical protein